jgi:hypothetical protein
MISVSSQSLTALEKQLEELIKTTERKLKNMVQSFAYEIAFTAASNTPIGDSVQYFSLYKARAKYQDLPDEEGMARGNWQYSEGSATLQYVYGQDSIAEAMKIFKAKAASNYKLGDSFSIVNTVPYFDELEDNYSKQTKKQGILQPSYNTVLSAYKINLPLYYQNG